MPASLVPFGPVDAASATIVDDRVARGEKLLIGDRAYYPPAWWMDPLRTILFLVLPIFCFAAYFNRFNYWTFNASEDFVTRRTFGLGLYSMGLMLSGIVVARMAVRRQDTVTLLDVERATTILVRLGWVTILAYALLLGSLLFQPELALDLLRGNAAAATELRTVLGRIPGITSFVQFDIVYLALASVLVTLARFRMPTRLWVMTAVVLGLTFLRAVFASERLALLEAMAAIVVVPVAFRWKPSLWRSVAPFIGIVAVFMAFAAGEYFRSWQYYQNFYDSYLEFIIQRFAGYFSTSINNGAGAYLIYGQFDPVPQITSGWVTKFPGLSRIFGSDGPLALDEFLSRYATIEFNNPGGFYAAFLDYPFAIASAFMVFVGIAIGLIHRSFENKGLVGLLLYPAMFLGLTDLVRILYISDTRTLPIFLGVFVTVWAIEGRKVPRESYLARIAEYARKGRQ